MRPSSLFGCAGEPERDSAVLWTLDERSGAFPLFLSSSVEYSVAEESGAGLADGEADLRDGPACGCSAGGRDFGATTGSLKLGGWTSDTTDATYGRKPSTKRRPASLIRTYVFLWKS